MEKFVYSSKCVRLGKRHAVTVQVGKDGSHVLEFISPITRKDIREGKSMPRAEGIRNKNQLITRVLLHQRSAKALKAILNELTEL